MKNLKKVLAFVTVFTMLLSVVASAGTLYPDVDDNASYAEAVETLNALGIMIGDEKGNFNPDASITRAETAAIVVRMKNLGDAASAAGGTKFDDVAADHWAAGYINLAEQSGIINGYGDGTFGPSNPVTFEQVIKMIVAALGYTPKAEANGGYPSGYMIVASQNDITKGVSVTAGAEAPRAAVARMVFNALEVPVMEQVSFKKGEEEYAAQDGGRYPLKTVLKDYLKVYKYEGVVTDTYLVSGNSDDDFIKILLDKTTDPDEIVGEETTFAEGKTNAVAYLGYWVVAYGADDDETGDLTLLGITKKSGKNEELEIAGSKIENSVFDDDDEELIRIDYWKNDSDSSTTKLDIDAQAFFYNGRTDDAGLVIDFLDDLNAGRNVFGTLTLIDNDNDDEYEIIMLRQATANYLVAAVNASAKSLEEKDGSNIDIDVDDEDVITKFFKADGSAAEFADIKVGDVLTVYESSDNKLMTVYISDAKVEGTVKEEVPDRSGDNGYVIDGKTYNLAFENNVAKIAVNVGDEGTFYLNDEGRIVAKDAKAGSGNYAYLYKGDVTNDINGTVVELKFLTSNGTWETKKLANKVTVNNAGGSINPVEAANDAFAPLFEIESHPVLDENGQPTGKTEYVFTEGAVENRLFQYDTNSSDRINRLYIAANGEDADAFSKDLTADDKDYKKSQNKLGNIYFNDETVVFSVKADKGVDVLNDEDDIKVTKVSALFQDGSDYTVDAYDIEDGAPKVAVAYHAEGDIIESTKLLLITKVSEVTNTNGTKITKIYGYQNGQEVNAEFAEDGVTFINEDVNNVEAGDVVIFNLDADNAIDKIEVLMTNDKARAIIAGEEDAYVEASGDYSQNIFGFVQKKKTGGNMILAENWVAGATTLKDDDGETDLSLKMTTSGINVYEVNLNRSTPSYQVLSYGKVDAETRPNKDAHWIFVRVYDDAVVDAVAYRVTNPEEEPEEVVDDNADDEADDNGDDAGAELQ